MTVIIPYCRKDQAPAFSLASLLADKCDVARHSILMCADGKDQLPPKGVFPPCVSSMHVDGAAQSYPQGPNDTFAMICRIMAGEFGKDHPRWFFAEPDAFPTCSDALDRIEAEHERLGVQVSGCLVDWLSSGVDTPAHLNGNLVMDRQVVLDHPVLSRRVISAWDCHHAELLLSIGADNKEVWLPLRVSKIMPTMWWLDAKRPDGHVPAWVHGCHGMAVLDHLHREGLKRTPKPPIS